jgi:hypothetical protein
MSEDPKIQREVAQIAVDKELSVRETERAIKRTAGASDKAAVAKRSIILKDANMRAAETKLTRHLSTNVKINPSGQGKGGKIEIEYYGPDDLTRVFELLMKQ